MIFPEELKNKFRQFIAGSCGLYFKDHDIKSLEAALRTRAGSCGIDSAAAYYAYLTTSKNKRDEFRQLLNILTVNHTYFFRNEPHFRVLKEKVLPEIITRKTKNLSASPESRATLRVWSAGCSSGEEPYSIAMVIRDLIEDFDRWDIRIFATDVSSEALQAAEKGVYGKNSMRLVNSEHKKKYFIEKRDLRCEVKNSIKSMVKFNYLNLIDEEYPENIDIIFCRNVTIYFDLETTIKIMNKIHASLCDTGHLFIGYSESLQFISDKFEMEDFRDAIIYRKARKKAVSGIKGPKPPEKKAQEIIDEISKAEMASEKKIETQEHTVPSGKMEDLLVQIMKDLYMKKYDRALTVIEQAHAVDRNVIEPYFFAAEIYMNQGRIDEAKEKLCVALRINALFAPLYYLLGNIYIETEDFDQARENFKKALYLDKNFVLAHFSLGVVLRKVGRIEDALRQFRNTQKILLKDTSGDTIAFSGGFNAATLISVCKNNIERLKSMG